MLVVGIEAQLTGTVAVYTPMFLIPHLYLHEGMTLAAATLVAAAPRYGSLLSIFWWGVVVDRLGERLTLVVGFSLALAALVTALTAPDVLALGIALFAVGIGGACVNSASARVVSAWFPTNRRGLAMGIRQASQPSGIALAAAVVPLTAGRYGTDAALLLPVLLCSVTILVSVVVLVDPPREDRSRVDAALLRSPYARNWSLARLHLSSALLMVPQIAIWTFALLWLIERQDWSPASAGALVAGCEVAGAAVRIGAGAWSDRVGSRVRPMRVIAASSVISLLGFALLESSSIAVLGLVVVSLVSVADNGLGVTAVVEAAGNYWGGRAIGVHSTGQLAVSAMAPSGLEISLSAHGYALTLGSLAVLPFVAIFLLPSFADHSQPT